MPRLTEGDLTQPTCGFGNLPHRNVEIYTPVVDGEFKHQDSMGTTKTLRPNTMQDLSAVTAVVHLERNVSGDTALRFIQLWEVPRKSGHEPEDSSIRGNKCEWTPSR
ncbi:putative quercetin 2,3-dioxygenase [Porphyridium purpureum]|uniref:Putative quercetin 2,3-dioxygenase n=1 Tax=Porphyridium purpureum TaxID=35688 RepID=A0A5J4YHL1_PORPP|nr:putative quercetin 2,3-dioxygenase [Porphyridium purpureum]|eukprot:POR4408..scf289_17